MEFYHIPRSTKLTTNTQVDEYEYIEEQLRQGHSIRSIARALGKDHSNLTKWIKKQRAKRHPKVLQETETITERESEAPYSSNIALSPSQSQISNKADSPANVVNISRIKYGNLNATGYISDLNDDDWIRKYCGVNYSWTLDYLTELRSFIRTKDKCAVYEPRGHGKTLSVIGLFARDVIEKHIPILMIVSGPTAARRIYKEFKRILRSVVVREDYGDVADGFNLTTGEITLKEELVNYIDPAIKIVGRGGDIIGSHPMRIHLEDIIQEEFKAEESNEGLMEWFTEVVNYCAINETKISVTGTRKGVDDFYSHLPLYNFEILHKRAIELIKGHYPSTEDLIKELYDDGSGLMRERILGINIPTDSEYKTLNCPNHPLERLLIEKTLHGESFESQMQNNPLPSTGLYFKTEDFIVIEHTKYNANDYVDYYLFLDPAYGTSNKADNTALMVICVMPPKLVIVDGIIDHLTWSEMENWAKHYIDRYNPHIFYVEENFSQIWIKQATQAQGWPVMPIKQNKNKIMRIAATKVHWIEKRIEILRDAPLREKLYTEYVLFDEKPSTSTKKDDGLDCVAMACEHLAQYVRISQIGWFN